jgi:hypothetical protein
MLNSYSRASCDPDDVRRSVLQIAAWADFIEKLLTGRDDR